MWQKARWSGGLVGLGTLLFAIGCSDAKDLQIQALQEENAALKREKADWESRLLACQSELEAARRRALELQDQVNRLQNDLALANSRPAQVVQQPVSNLPPGWVGNESIAWVDISDEVLFDSGKADLKGSARSVLQRVVGDIRSRFGDREIWVVGHTDSDPIKLSAKLWKDNLDLSANRAMTVVREFYKLGMEPGRLLAAGAGEHHPKTSNASRPGKAANRRVQIIAAKMPPLVAPNTGLPAEGEATLVIPAEMAEIFALARE